LVVVIGAAVSAAAELGVILMIFILLDDSAFYSFISKTKKLIL
jgi:hypothetical protein